MIICLTVAADLDLAADFMNLKWHCLQSTTNLTLAIISAWLDCMSRTYAYSS